MGIPHQSKNTILSKTNPKHTFRTQPIQTFSNTNHTTLHLTSTMSGYDSYYSQGYQNQNQYPSYGFSGSQSYQTQQPYYQDNRAPYAQDQYGSSNSYYNSNSQPAPGQEADRGMMGAVAGGAAGAFGGHKAGHGFLGSIGGAIIGSLAEDYAKKNKKNKHHRKAGGSNSNSMMGGGLGSTASSFFNRKN